MSGAARRGAAAATLIVTLGSTAPAIAAPWAVPSLHGGEVAGSASGTDPGHAAEHHVVSVHAEHEGSDLASGGQDHHGHGGDAGADDTHEAHGAASGHDDHEAAGSDPSAGADDGHEEHGDDASGHDDHEAAGSDPSAGADNAHEERDGDASGHDDHNNQDAAGPDATAGADDDHNDHDGEAASSGHDDAGHGGEPDTVSDATKTRVLGGFGVVNAAAVGGAFLLRRRDRKCATKKLRTRADQSDSSRADRDRTRGTR